MEKIISFFQGQMERPGVFSWFHIVGVLLIIAATILISYFFKDAKEKTYKRILLVSWIILVVFEIIKQLVRSYYPGNPSYWEYDFYNFPFHICSMCLYMLPILIFVKREKHPSFTDAINGFSCFIGFIGGIIVVAYPEMVMTKFIFINIQTLVHHGLQVILGVFIFVWNRKTITIKTYFSSLIVFMVCATIALIINVSLYPREIDMFYLNPYLITTMPLANIVQEKAGFVVYAILFILAIFGAAYLVYFVETRIYKLIQNKRKSA